MDDASLVVRPSEDRPSFYDFNGSVLRHRCRKPVVRVVFVSPIPDSAIANIPPLVRWVLQPRPNIGGDVNTAGATSQLYFGLVWTAPLAHDLFTPDDGLFLSLGLGPAFNNGHIATSQPDRKSL